MASAVADLEAGLQAMLNLKPPGVSGSRITSLTTLCVNNIQSESVLIQKIYTHFKKAPATHKLGVLYVIDSVTRKWVEQAKAQGHAINGSAPDGTYAAGVHRVTELMPVLMNDILSSVPAEQKDKIKKLLDIWEKGQTFPAQLIESFKEKLSAPQPQESTTPPGSPPSDAVATVSQRNTPAPSAAPPTANGSSILEALANIARQNTAAPSSSHSQPASSSAGLPSATFPQNVPASYPVQQPQQQQVPSYPSVLQPVNPTSLPFQLPGMLSQPQQNTPPVPAPGNSNPAFGAPPPATAAPSALDNNTQQQIMLIKALVDQGVPFDKIPALVQSLTGAANGGGASLPQPASAQASSSQYSPAGQQPWQMAAQERNRGYQDGAKSPNRYGRRSRSRSPDRRWDNSRGSPRGRDHNGKSPQHGGRFDDRDYRQRSPQGRNGHSHSPELPPPGKKWIEYDRSLPSGSIKVYSRTLFVGGVTCPESELRSIFSRFGTVQTCIVNKDKRHAFVKMLTRRDALAAKEGTEDNRNLEIPLRTRWGVGYGPRDCSNYSTGVSIIPIHKLTEADRKWMLTAPYGGSGGAPIEAGLCVEEPDIEIGAGVSSKAISRRMQTDKGGSNGPRSTRHNKDDDRDYNDGNRKGRGNKAEDANPNNMPMGQSFPFGIGTLPNGMPNFPAGFTFPDPSSAR